MKSGHTRRRTIYAHINKLSLFLAVAILFLVSQGHGAASVDVSGKYEEFEGARLSRELALDGRITDADTIYQSLVPSEKAEPDALWALALIRWSKGEREGVAETLKSATSAARMPSEVERLTLDRAEVAEGTADYRECAELLDRVEAILTTREKFLLQKANCEERLQHFAAALHWLRRGVEKFPSSVAVARAEIAFLVARGLISEAERGSVAAARRLPTAGAILAAIEPLVTSGALNSVSRALVVARLRFPKDVDLSIASAQIDYKRGSKRFAADEFRRASRAEPKYALHASELYRELGLTVDAEATHLRVPETRDRVKQKLGFALDRSEYASIAAMTPTLSRSALLHSDVTGDNDDLIYASAYARFRSGDFSKALLLSLSRIRKPSLAEKSIALRKLIEDCRSTPATCRI